MINHNVTTELPIGPLPVLILTLDVLHIVWETWNWNCISINYAREWDHEMIQRLQAGNDHFVIQSQYHGCWWLSDERSQSISTQSSRQIIWGSRHVYWNNLRVSIWFTLAVRLIWCLLYVVVILFLRNWCCTWNPFVKEIVIIFFHEVLVNRTHRNCVSISARWHLIGAVLVIPTFVQIIVLWIRVHVHINIKGTYMGPIPVVA